MSNYPGDRDDLRSIVPAHSTGRVRYCADREETDACQAGTVGCCIDHDRDHGSCEGW